MSKISNRTTKPVSLWVPQIAVSSANAAPNPIGAAFRAFCDLFDLDTSSIKDTPLASLDLNQLLQHLPQIQTPLCVLGTLKSRTEASQYSWEQLGLDLFDLPLFAAADRKIFRYIPVLDLSAHYADLKACLALKPTTPLDIKVAIEQLEWAKCHQFAQRIQSAVGHGERDRLQTMSIDKMHSALEYARSPRTLLSCQDECGLSSRIEELLNTQLDRIDRLEYAQKIAALDCHNYRLAATQYQPTLDILKFQRIVILENDTGTDDQSGFRQALVAQFEEMGFDKVKDIIYADPKLSWENFCLWDKQGDILNRLTEVEGISPGAILTCFDLDLGKENIPEGLSPFLSEVFGGFWILYGTARQYARVPRLIITGFRTQDLMGYAAGGAAYLLKPISPATLKVQMEQAAILQNVKWICPKPVRQDYGNLLGNADCFTNAVGQLQQKLAGLAISLEALEEITPESIAGSDLIVLDLCCVNDTQDRLQELLVAIAEIRQFNHHASLLLVLPMTEDVNSWISNCYRKLPLSLRNGKDAVVKKPMWIVSTGCTDPTQSLDSMILQQLQQFHDYDIKYQVLIPVAAIIGRPNADWVDRVLAGDTSADDLFAPLLPLIINAYGLSARIQDVLGKSRRQDVLGKILEGLCKELKISVLDFKERVDERFETSLVNLLEVGSKHKIQRYLTLEAWLRASVDRQSDNSRTNSKYQDLPNLIQPLVKVFGGTTRYEFSVRGSWYDDTEQAIDDMLVVIEFCAKSSIAAKAFIETTVVDYLCQVANEDCVLIQEIPLHGYLKWKR